MRIKKSLFSSALLIFFFINNAFAEKIGDLNEILNPFQIQVSQDILLISDQNQIFFFSLDQLKIIRKIGGQGEGPGQFLVNPFIKILSDRILAYTPFLIVSFSKNGVLMNQTRYCKGSLWNLDYIKGNYIGSLLKYSEKGTYTNFTILDSNFEEVKIISSIFSKSPTRMKKVKSYIVKPLNKFQCYKDEIYVVSENNPGFLISVFNHKGDLIRKITQDYEQIKISKREGEKLLEDYKNIPPIRKRWESLNRLFDYVIPEFFPPIHDFRITNDIIFVKTFKSSSKGVEFILLDLKGKLLGKTFLPDIKTRYFDIYNNKYYYLIDNETEETWEFHRIDISIKNSQ